MVPQAGQQGADASASSQLLAQQGQTHLQQGQSAYGIQGQNLPAQAQVVQAAQGMTLPQSSAAQTTTAQLGQPASTNGAAPAPYYSGYPAFPPFGYGAPYPPPADPNGQPQAGTNAQVKSGMVAPQPVQPMTQLAQAAAMEIERAEAERNSEPREDAPAAPGTGVAPTTTGVPPANGANATAGFSGQPPYPPYFYPYPPGAYMMPPGYPPYGAQGMPGAAAVVGGQTNSADVQQTTGHTQQQQQQLEQAALAPAAAPALNNASTGLTSGSSSLPGSAIASSNNSSASDLQQVAANTSASAPTSNAPSLPASGATSPVGNSAKALTKRPVNAVGHPSGSSSHSHYPSSSHHFRPPPGSEQALHHYLNHHYYGSQFGHPRSTLSAYDRYHHHRDRGEHDHHYDRYDRERERHHPGAAVDDFFRHAHDPSHPSHHHSSRFHRHAFAPYPASSAASSRQPSPELSPRSDLYHAAEEEDNFAGILPGAPMSFEYTPSTSPVLGPLRGMTLRNPHSRPGSPVHSSGLRFPPNASSSAHLSGAAGPAGTAGFKTDSPNRSPDYDTLSSAAAAVLGGSGLAFPPPHHPHSLSSHHSSHSHRSAHRTQPYSRTSSRHASPVDLPGGGMSSMSGPSASALSASMQQHKAHSGTTSGASSGPGSVAGSSSHPPTPGSSLGLPPHPQPGTREFAQALHQAAAQAASGKYPYNGQSGATPYGSLTSGGHSSRHSSQPGSRANTPPLSPDENAANSNKFAVPHPVGTTSPNHQHRQHHVPSGFSMTPISFGQTYSGGLARSQGGSRPTSPR